MAFVAALAPILTAATAAVGLYSGIKSLTTKQEKPPEPAKLPEAPKPGDAQAQAAQEMQKRRRASLLSGGETDLTKGAAVVPGMNVAKKSLLGQ